VENGIKLGIKKESAVRIFLVWVFVLVLVEQGFGQQEARVVTYNLLNYDSGSGREGYFQTVMGAVEADVVVAQEMGSQAGVNSFLNGVLNVSGNGYAAGIFLDGPDTDNAIFYKLALFDFVSNTPIATTLRDINAFKLVHLASGDTLIVYSVHLKAGDTPADRQQRLDEVMILRQVTNSLLVGTDFLVVGDFNVYGSSEPAYEALLNTSGTGYVLDPINSPGEWHNDLAFALIHTQSTRTRQFGGGAPGGMDDRFDMALASQGVMDAGGIEYVNGSYAAFGNDGMHFNDSINAPPNTAVPPAVANGLHYGSDHLPVVLTLKFENVNGIAENEGGGPEGFVLYQNYPNPFNGVTKIRFRVARQEFVTLKVYDITGKVVATLAAGYLSPGEHEYEWDAKGMASGIYFYRVGDAVRRMVLMR